MLQGNEELINAEVARYGGEPAHGVADIKTVFGPIRDKLNEADRAYDDYIRGNIPEAGMFVLENVVRLEDEARAIAKRQAAWYPILADPTLNLRLLVKADDRQLQTCSRTRPPTGSGTSPRRGRT